MTAYENPLWHGYLADPFIYQADGTYHAIGTARDTYEDDGKFFPLLRSVDLVRWHYLGGALLPASRIRAAWAPEMLQVGDTYYLYYSGNELEGDEGHRIRVATAKQPEGPFRDVGRVLLPSLGFTIDPNPFRDPATHELYLYFATDYLNDEPYGTGIGVVRMTDPLTPERDAVPVARATESWQIYEENRLHMGRRWPRWYCVEGPCVVAHDQRYWCWYSAGRWAGERYGVGFAVAEHPLGPWRTEPAAQGPSVLRGVAGEVFGPGHCSLTVTPDGTVPMLVYHAWDAAFTRRRMCMDPLLWSADGPRCDGPSTRPRVVAQQAKLLHA